MCLKIRICSLSSISFAICSEICCTVLLASTLLFISWFKVFSTATMESLISCATNHREAGTASAMKGKMVYTYIAFFFGPGRSEAALGGGELA